MDVLLSDEEWMYLAVPHVVSWLISILQIVTTLPGLK